MISNSKSYIIPANEAGEIKHNRVPAVYLPGWTADVVFSGFSGLPLLCLRHEDGREAVWYLDEELNRIGGSVAEISPAFQSLLIEEASGLIDGLIGKILIAPVPEPLDAREDGFFRLPEAVRVEILDLYLAAFDSNTRFVSWDEVDPQHPGSQLADLGNRRQVLRRTHMHELLGTSRVQSGIVELLRTGSMAFPSPIDGKAMSARHSLILNRNMYAYRCLDEASGTVMYVIAGEAYLRPVCLFIPEGRLCVSFSVDAIQGQMPGMWQEFANRVVRHGDLLVRYFALKETRPLHAWQGSTSIHLGHILWNDISGIAAMIPQVSDDQLPRFAVYDAADHPEMYGPLDEIFPRLRGLVDRRHTYLEAEIPDFYRRGQVVFRSSSFFVSRMVRDSILACVKPMAPDSPAAVCARAHQAGIPVVMFGLRVENRTVVELEHFCLHRIDCLASSLGRAILVIDGHNSYPGEPENVVWSHGEHGATRPPIVIERDLVAAMQTRAEGTELLIASTIGLPLSESLACGKESDVLVTMWGAGLAKYRWVCNIPGVVLTSKYGLNHRGDLPLYHSPRYMEDASPLAFVPEDMITDAPDAPLLVDLGGVNPSIANFHVDERRAFAFIRAVIERACTTGKQRDEVGGG